MWPDSTQLSGTIPDSLGNLTALTYMGWPHRLSGTIPTVWESPVMDLTNTMITGTLPQSLSLLTNLTNLRLGEYMQDRYLWF
eukprot:SAG31_NODE_232_length_19710_cov_17.109581_14_plen_82_part_00